MRLKFHFWAECEPFEVQKNNWPAFGMISRLHKFDEFANASNGNLFFCIFTLVRLCVESIWFESIFLNPFWIESKMQNAYIATSGKRIINLQWLVTEYMMPANQFLPPTTINWQRTHQNIPFWTFHYIWNMINMNCIQLKIRNERQVRDGLYYSKHIIVNWFSIENFYLEDQICEHVIDIYSQLELLDSNKSIHFHYRSRFCILWIRRILIILSIN